VAFGAAREDVERYGSLEVPDRFRNAPTRLMRELGYGKDYRYAQDEPEAYVAGERYLPDAMPDRRYYSPAPRGFEIRVGEAMNRRREQEKKES
jgi:putative ATPase